MTRQDTGTEKLARLLALGAGVDWDRLSDHPGYSRYYWREQAHAMRAAVAADDGSGATAARAV